MATGVMSSKNSRHFAPSLVLCTYVSILILSAASYLPFSDVTDNLVFFRYDRWLAAASLLYFCCLLVFAFGNIKRFCLALPLVLLTVPNAINSLFPSILLGPVSDYSNAAFPFVTHVDIYFIFGLFNLARVRFIASSLNIDALILAMMFFFMAALIFIVFSAGDITRYVNNAFHIRYLAGVYLLHTIFSIAENRSAVLNGLIVALPIILLECVFTTVVNGYSFFGHFSSGAFANNVLGHFLAFASVLLIFTRNIEYESSLLSDIVIILTLMGLALTGVRGAYLSFSMCLVIVFSITHISRKVLSLLVPFVVFGLVMLAVLVLDLDYWAEFLTSVFYIIENGFVAENIRIDDTVTSMFTRVTLWIATIQIYLDNIWFGVGFAQWNLLKADYGVPFRVLLDPHNDYLFYLVSYGSVIGACFFWLVFIKPIAYLFRGSIGAKLNPYSCAILCFGFSGLTNACSSKHQIFAFVLVISFFAVFYQRHWSFQGVDRT